MNINNILVLYKQSAYSIYFDHPKSFLKRRGIAPREISRFKKTHQKHSESLRIVQHILKRLGLKYSMVPRGQTIDYGRFNMVITVGGDGTFLEGARGVSNQLILGVNSDPSWSVGRFCPANTQSLEAILHCVLSEKALIKKFSRIKLRVGQDTVNVLNDILICHHNPAAMSRYYLTVGAKKEEQKSSGLWISTGAGSSGAIKSAGGKKISPTSDKIQYRPRELYSGTGSNVYKLRGDVLSSGTKFKVMSLMREGFVFVDGSHLCFPFDFGETISVTGSNYPLNVIWSK